MANPVDCTHCGAPMQPAPDGRMYGCHYCGNKLQVAVSAEQIAAGFALDLTNTDAFLSRLAGVLTQGFAEHTQVKARGMNVEAIEVDLTPDLYAVHREGTRVVATHKKMVRGIALKTQTLALDVWVDHLMDSLARAADANARAAWVLSRLGGGNNNGNGNTNPRGQYR